MQLEQPQGTEWIADFEMVNDTLATMHTERRARIKE